MYHLPLHKLQQLFNVEISVGDPAIPHARCFDLGNLATMIATANASHWFTGSRSWSLSFTASIIASSAWGDSSLSASMLKNRVRWTSGHSAHSRSSTPSGRHRCTNHQPGAQRRRLWFGVAYRSRTNVMSVFLNASQREELPMDPV